MTRCERSTSARASASAWPNSATALTPRRPRAGSPGVALYAMSKAAVAGLTRGLARDLGPRGITVNNVRPGPTETEIVADESVRAYLRAQIPVGRMGQDAEIAGLVAYLVGAEAGYVNGASLTIDGGFVA